MSDAVHYDESATLPEKADDPFVHGLRTCDAAMTAHGGYLWPRKGVAHAPDWDPSPQCGNGLHFLRNGEGNSALLSNSPDTVWLVIRSYTSETVDIDSGKSKAMRCEVIFAGPKREAVTRLRAIVGADKRIVFAMDHVEGGKSICCGDGSTITAEGNLSTITATGDGSTITAEGNLSTITATGDGSTITATGHRSTITANGHRSTITANGDGSTITAEGNRSIITANGDGSIITANGDGSIITANGDGSIITANGHLSTITAGDNSCITAAWWDFRENRRRFAAAIVGQDGTLKPDTPYRCEAGVWTEVVAEQGGAA